MPVSLNEDPCQDLEFAALLEDETKGEDSVSSSKIDDNDDNSSSSSSRSNFCRI